MSAATWELIAALRYQVVTPQVTTMGPCARGCGQSSRGSRDCVACVGADLSMVIGADKAREVLACFSALRNAVWATDDLLGSLV